VTTARLNLLRNRERQSTVAEAKRALLIVSPSNVLAEQLGKRPRPLARSGIGRDREGYNEAKTEFVQRILRRTFTLATKTPEGLGETTMGKRFMTRILIGLFALSMISGMAVEQAANRLRLQPPRPSHKSVSSWRTINSRFRNSLSSPVLVFDLELFPSSGPGFTSISSRERAADSTAHVLCVESAKMRRPDASVN